MRQSRRDFMSTAALGSAGLAIAGVAGNGLIAAPPSASKKSTVDQVAQADVEKFVKSLKGRAVRPGDGEYEKARLVWNGKFQKRPGLVAFCTGSEDVAKTIEFARKHNLALAVRSGKHSLAGKSTNDGGVILDLSSLKKVDVDVEKRVARVDAGVLLGEFDEATVKHGLATTAGTEISTGVAGLTLGGGLGYLMGKYGLTIDNLRSVEIVLADGRVVTASNTENEDLFWAVRGAGANFGVTTSFEYDLHPMKTILAGELKFPHASLRDMLKLYREFNSTIPDDVGITASLAPFHDGKALTGPPLAALTVGYFGDDHKAGEKVLEPLRKLRPIVSDTIEPREYLWLQQLWKMPPNFMPRAVVRSNFLKDLSDETIDVMVAHSAKAPPGTGKFVMEYVHGKATRVAPDAMSYPNRFAGYPCSVHADCITAEQETVAEQWATDFWREMKPHLRSAVYSNYLADEGAERARATYGDNYQRLAELKRKYDPTNFFSSNQNIVPAS